MSIATKTKKPTRGISQTATVTTGPGLMQWRKKQGISRKLFASMADCSERTLATCEKAAQIPKTIERPVTETVRLLGGLKELAGEDDVLKAWLVAPNRAFGNKTPLSLIESGESDRLWEMVYQLRQKAFA